MDLNKCQNKISSSIHLQTFLFSLSMDTMEKLNYYIKSSIFITENGIISLSHNFLYFIDYRPRDIMLLINCIMNLIQSSPNLRIFECIFNEITKARPTCTRLYFIYQCINHNIIPKATIMPYVKSFDYFSWFAPIVDELDPQLFQSFMSQKDEDLFISNVEDLKKDNWRNHRLFASEGMNHNEVARLIRIDDIESLKKVPHFNINMRLPSSPFESIDILNHGCTPLHYASYFNSVKCYKTMLERGASPYATDFNGHNTIHFAVAGSSLAILYELLSSSFDENNSLFARNVVQAIQYAVIYHKNELFDDLLNRYGQFADVSSVFLSAAKSDNLSIILKCIDNGVDVNCVNSCGETALIIAATYNHKELVDFLLTAPKIEINHCDTFGRNALICAIDKGNMNIVKILLNDKRIDINAYDKGISYFFILMGIRQFTLH